LLKPRGIFQAKIVKNCHFLGQGEKNEKKEVFFQNSTIQIYTRLLWECEETNSKTLIEWIERL